MSKAQFDTEFAAIKDIFAALGKLRLSFNGLRPFLDWIPADEDGRLQTITGRLSQFVPLLNTLVSTVESAFPFVPDDIYEQLEICMRIGKIEVKHSAGGCQGVKLVRL
ncbi:MAG TPA: hypothetical protein VI386_11625 [Candidatus Sulfotelmatobacter sp.]